MKPNTPSTDVKSAENDITESRQSNRSLTAFQRSARVMELRIRMSQMPETDHPPISWWRHEPERTATGYRWLDWLTKPYWQIWSSWQTHLFWKTMDEKFLLSEAERELFRLARSEFAVEDQDGS